MLVPAVWGLLLPNLLVALVLGFAIGQWFRRVPQQGFDEGCEGWLLALRSFERGGSWYEDRLRIKAWKDHLPETGGRFGGVSKRALPAATDGGLNRFVVECRRGERTHWMFVAASPVFLVLNSGRTGLALTSAVATINAPFIAVLRYNRARVMTILDRQGRRSIAD